MIISRLLNLARAVSRTGPSQILGGGGNKAADLVWELVPCTAASRSLSLAWKTSRHASHALTAWRHCRAMSSSSSADDRLAALQRLSRAGRHRSPKSTHAPSGSRGPPGPSESSSGRAVLQQQQQQDSSNGSSMVSVTPSETQASDVQLSGVVGHQALIITRPVEWGTVIFGYEQANKVGCQQSQFVGVPNTCAYSFWDIEHTV